MSKKWYGLHAQSGMENRVRMSLLERIKQANMEEFFDEIFLPSETVVEVKHGEKKTSKRKFFPGYMLIKMELTDETWHLVKGTPKALGFIGGTTPFPIPDEEVAKAQHKVAVNEAKPAPKVLYQPGDIVRVVDGPFLNFTGTVEEVRPEKGVLTASVSIFGRATRVDLEFSQAERVTG